MSKLFGLVKPTMRRFEEVLSAKRFDVVFVQREAMFFGPEIFEWLIRSMRTKPLILDLDDATYIPYTSPTFGSLGSRLKFFGKTDRLIVRSDAVVCGNRFIAEYVESKSGKAVVIPTVVDTDVFRPAERPSGEAPVIGWIGTHSTFPLLESIFGVLEKLAAKYRFKLRVIGSGRDEINIEGVDVEVREWRMETEAADFQSLDIGLYPITTTGSADRQWLLGKSGFKAIQYLAVGIPFVMTPYGVCAEIGEPGRSHFNAESEEEWYSALEALILSPEKRIEMGRHGRALALKNYSLPDHARALEAVIRQTAAAHQNE